MENRKEKKTEIEGNKALKSTEVKQQNNMKKEKTTIVFLYFWHLL